MRSIVGLEKCRSYEKRVLLDAVESLASVSGLEASRDTRVLIKPNLVSAGGGRFHLACTSPQWIAAVAEWFVEQGAKVRIGDSPAFGTAKMVLGRIGADSLLTGCGARVVNFSRSSRCRLPCGVNVPVAVEALECDLLLNLPRVKAHNQLYVSLAVKNYFGVVTGWHKALHHARYGDRENRFEEVLADLPGLFPNTYTLIDGVIAMHRTGPMKGEAYDLGVLGGAFDPVAMDTALLEIIGADPGQSQIWQECLRRDMPGTDLDKIRFPLSGTAELKVDDFVLPDALNPVTFHPLRMLAGGYRRMVSRLK